MVASLVAEYGFQSMWAQYLQLLGSWSTSSIDVVHGLAPRQVEFSCIRDQTVSLVLVGRFFATEPPGKPSILNHSELDNTGPR